MEEIIAKIFSDGSSEDLFTHTRKVAEAAGKLLQRQPVQEQIKQLGYEIEPAARTFFWTVVLHDVGKGAVGFQDRIKNNRPTSQIPHPFYGLPVVYNLMKTIFARKIYSKNDFISLASENAPTSTIFLLTMCHHSDPYDRFYNYLGDDRTFNYLEEPLCTFLDKIEKIKAESEFEDFLEEEISLCDLKGVINSVSGLKAKAVKNKIKDLKGIWKDSEIDNFTQERGIFSLLLSLAREADWIGSEKDVDIDSKLKSQIMTEDIGVSYEPHDYQQRLADEGEHNMILRAPCGRGKTYASLMWFEELKERGIADRLVFCLPTQITCNSMAEELKEEYDLKNEVGLSHGNSLAMVLFEEEGEEQEHNILKEARFKDKRAAQFLEPAVVSTVDHVMLSLIHGYRGSEASLGRLQTSALVFDEAHAYDGLALANMREMFAILRDLNIPHLVMSATLPQSLRKELKIEDYSRVEDESGFKWRPFKVSRKPEPIIQEDNIGEELPEMLAEGLEKGDKQLVVVNTVSRAAKVWENLRESAEIPKEYLRLLHSRFIYRDRIQREREVIDEFKEDNDKPLIAIATQVVEISLDITADRLYTELAPADGIAQRAGRCNRGGKDPEGTVYIAPYENELPYKDAGEILTRTDELFTEGPLSYGDISHICNEVYSDLRLTASDLARWFDLTTLFGPGPVDMWEEKGFRTRDTDDFRTIPVIPERFEEEFRKEPGAKYDLFVVQVPAWWRNTNLGVEKPITYVEGDNFNYFLCHYEYDDQVGYGVLPDKLTYRGSFI